MLGRGAGDGEHFLCNDNIIITQTLHKMNTTYNYCSVACVYNHTVIMALSFMSNVFTDDYLIGIQFHTVESSKTPIMHHCLIKVAFRTHEILSQNPFHHSYMQSSHA